MKEKEREREKERGREREKGREREREGGRERKRERERGRERKKEREREREKERERKKERKRDKEREKERKTNIIFKHSCCYNCFLFQLHFLFYTMYKKLSTILFLISPLSPPWPTRPPLSSLNFDLKSQKFSKMKEILTI